MDLVPDSDPVETREWRDALDSVLAFEGAERAHFLLHELMHEARRKGAPVPYSANTPYLNTIPPDRQAPHPGDRSIEHKIRSYIRWNALAIVLRANKESSELGGHIASFQSSALLYDTGFMHFWHAPSEGHGGDLIYVQGHVSPGIYARSFIEGRLSEDRLLRFRQEVDGGGLSSYPHPWLMPDYWQFPTVSMGLGPLMAIYQARFLKYLQGRGLAETGNRKVWAFLGDGECDEPESLGAISLGGREHLDNLVFVINCNLQRLDGPVRGNGKIIQELEAIFKGAGWNVLKVLWGSGWDKLLAADTSGILLKRMEEAVDGEYQDFKSKNGAYVREHFFGKYPELAAMVADWSDDQIWALVRGGHDPLKVYAAYQIAQNHKGQPTVILAKTVKGYGMGEAGEGQNITHQQKKMGETHLKEFRDRFSLPLADDQLKDVPFLRFEEGSPELTYLRERRRSLGGHLPARRRPAQGRAVPRLRGGLARAALPARAAPLPGRPPAGAPPQGRVARGAAALGVRRPAQGHRGADDLDHDGVRPHPQHAPARQEDRQARGADRARRVAHLRHGGHVPPVRHLQPGGPALPAGGRQPAHVLQGGQGRADPAGGPERARGHVLLDRGGDVLQLVEHADDPLLHLLLDVRLPARRRPRLGGRRHAGARLPPGRHRRADHAQRRGAAARGRPQPHLLLRDPELRLLRPDLLLRGRGRRPGRPTPDVRRAGGRLLLRHPDERELRAPCLAAGGRGGHRQGDVPAARGRGRRQRVDAARPAHGLRHHPARGDGGGGPAAAGLGCHRRRLELPELHRAAARGDGGRALEPAPPRGGAAEELGRALPRGPAGAGGGGHRLRPHLRRADPAPRRPALPRARHGRLRPLRLPAQAPRLLRGRPPLGGARGTREPGGRGRGPALAGGGGHQEVRDRPGEAGAVDGVRRA